MAIHILREPASLQPAYNPTVFAFSSTTTSNAGFQYIFQVYNFFEYLYTDRRPADADGFGIIDISRALRTYVKGNFNPTRTGSTATFDTFKYFNVVVGEEYEVSYTISATTNSSGQALFSTSIAHPFIVGDRVAVRGTTSYNASWTVDSVPSSTSFRINGSYVSNQAGSAVYADRRTTDHLALTGTNLHLAYDGAVDPVTFTRYHSDNYQLSASTDYKRFITNVPLSGWEVRMDSRMWLNGIVTTTDNLSQLITTYDANGSVEGSWTYAPDGGGSTRLTQFACGPWNIQNSPGFTPLFPTTSTTVFNATTARYSVSIVSATTLNQYSETYDFTIDRRCNRWTTDQVQLIFKDRMGSYVPFHFTLKNTEKTDYTRTEFTTPMGELYSDNTWGYKTYDRGRSTLSVNRRKSWVAHSDWVTSDANMAYLEELYASGEVYLIRNHTFQNKDFAADYVEQVCIPVIITSKDFTRKKRLNDALFNINIEFEEAYIGNVNI